MHLKITHKLNLKFSASLMFRVDPDECLLELDQGRKILTESAILSSSSDALLIFSVRTC